MGPFERLPRPERPGTTGRKGAAERGRGRGGAQRRVNVGRGEAVEGEGTEDMEVVERRVGIPTRSRRPVQPWDGYAQGGSQSATH